MSNPSCFPVAPVAAYEKVVFRFGAQSAIVRAMAGSFQPGLTGFNGVPGYKTNQMDVMVEAAGIEPASASDPPGALHAYSAVVLTLGHLANEENPKPVR